MKTPHPREFKCIDCLHKRRYTTGRDEYPGFTTIEYCSKKHWEGLDLQPEPKERDEDKLNEVKGLKKFTYDQNHLWAINQKNANRKAKALG